MSDEEPLSGLDRLRVDGDRMRLDLDALNRIGADTDRPGFNRPSFSEADMEARRWLMGRMEAAGLSARMDAVGNVFGRWEAGKGAAVLVGSHTDTVPEGGAFDGALGVVAALEATRALREAGLEPARPIEVVSTADEEGRFGGMLGSEAIAGLLEPGRLDAAVDAEGVRLAEAMRARGLDPTSAAQAARDDVAFFLELHVEQGPVLEGSGDQVGIVEGVSGCFNWTVTLTGEANHSGTTPMEMRRDAFRGLAAFGERIDGIVAASGGRDARLTVGKVALAPNFPHSVAGEAVFSIIGRDPEEAVMRRLAERCRHALEVSASAHGLGLAVVEQSWLSPVRLDGGVADAVAEEAAALGLKARRMVSGAGHDAQTMGRVARSGLIFVPSIGGVSHSPDERTDWEDCVAGARLLARALARLALA